MSAYQHTLVRRSCLACGTDMGLVHSLKTSCNAACRAKLRRQRIEAGISTTQQPIVGRACNYCHRAYTPASHRSRYCCELCRTRDKSHVPLDSLRVRAALPSVTRPTEMLCANLDCGNCRRCRASRHMTALRAAGRIPANTRLRDGWKPDEDALLRKLAGTMPLRALAAEITLRIGRRGEEAVRHRAQDLDISLAVRFETRYTIAAALGCDRDRGVPRLIEAGMPATWREDHRGGVWQFDRDAVAEWLRAHPWIVDARAINPATPIGRLVLPSVQRHRWLDCGELAALIGAHENTVADYLRGEPYERCLAGRHGGDGFGTRVYPAEILPVIRERVAAAQQEARTRLGRWAHARKMEVTA